MKKLKIAVTALLTGIMAIGTLGTTTFASPEDNSITVSIWAEPLALCSAFNSKAFNALVSHEICEPLVELNEDGSFSPALASSWEYVNDGKDIEFEIRDDVYFSDGEKMTIDDVVFSYNTIIELGYVDNVSGVMEKMEKIDDTHCRLVFKQTYGPAMMCVANDSMCIFPQKYYEENEDTFIRNPIGTGPYKLVEWKTGDSIILTANENYWGEPAAIKDVTFKIFTDDTAAAIALESGEIDVLTTVPATELARLQANPDLQIESAESLTCTWVFFNHEGVFADENVRLAVAYAINKDDVLIGATEGNGVVQETIFPTFLDGVDPDYVAPGNDLEKAVELMAEAGYPDGFDVTVQVPNDTSFYKALEIVQAQLSMIGINIAIEKVETGTWYSDVFETGNFDMGVVTNTLVWPDMDDMNIFYRSGQFLNTGHVEYDDLDALWDAFRNTPAGEERTKIGYEINQYLGDHAIVVPLYGVNNNIAATKDLKGLFACMNKGNYRVSDWSW